MAALESLEDPLVDRLVWRALQRGVGAVIARAPRAAVDCNRAEDELDPAVIGAAAATGSAPAPAAGSGSFLPARRITAILWRRADRRRAARQRLDRPTGPITGDRGPARAAHRPLRRRDPARLPFDAAAGRRHSADRFRRPPRPNRRLVGRRRSAGHRPRAGIRSRPQRSIRRRPCGRAARRSGAQTSTRSRSKSTGGSTWTRRCGCRDRASTGSPAHRSALDRARRSAPRQQFATAAE